MKIMSLSDLKPGQLGIVTSIEAKEAIKTRLMEMGLLKGTKLKLLKIAPLGDPLEIEVRDYRISLRKQEASQIKVNLSTERVL